MSSSRYTGVMRSERGSARVKSGGQWIHASLRDARTYGEVVVIIDDGKVDISVRRDPNEKTHTILALPLSVITDAGLFREWMREQVKEQDEADLDRILAECEAKEQDDINKAYADDEPLGVGQQMLREAKEHEEHDAEERGA